MHFNLKFDFTSFETAKIHELREKVLNCPELEIGTEDVLLSKFLNSASWDVSGAFDAISKYYDFKNKHPEWLTHHAVEHFRDHFLDLQTRFLLPGRDREGRLIAVFKTVDAFDKFPDYIYDIIEMDDLVFESLLLIPDVRKFGVSIIYDLSGITKNYLRMLSPQFARTINAKNEIVPFPNRILHLIQKGFLMKAATSLVMPFMGKDFQEKVIRHDGKNFDKLQEMIGYENLPADYGGPATNKLDANLLYNHILANSDYLVKLQSYRRNAL